MTTLDKRLGVVVLGMHRSGTSLVAELVHRLGVDLPEELMPPHPQDNPRGYFESREVAAINNQILASAGMSWADPGRLPPAALADTDGSVTRQAGALLDRDFGASERFVLKDPRFCRLLPPWLGALRQRCDDLVFLHVVRHPDAVLASLRRRLEAPAIRSAAVASESQGRLLWLRYNLEAERHTRGERRLILSYEEMVVDPVPEIRRIAGTLDVDPDPDLLTRLVRVVAPRSGEPPPVPASENAAFTEAVRELLLADDDDARAELDRLFEASSIRVPEPHQDEVAVEPDDAPACYAAELKEIVGSAGVPRRASGAGASRGQAGAVVFITQDPATRGHIYRVKNPVDALNRRGVAALWLPRERLREHPDVASAARILVFHRCPLDDDLERLFDEAGRRGVPVGFDVDDLIFDEEVIAGGYVRFIQRQGTDAIDHWRGYARRLKAAMALADFLVVPTAALRRAASALGKPVVEVPNTFSEENRRLAELWLAKRRSRPAAPLRIGYASGTPTHQDDFAVAEPAIREILDRHPSSVFTVVGHLDLEEFPDLARDLDRVERRPMVRHVNLAYELARLDVHVAPLELGNPFCDAKSPLKYFEPALVGTPSVVAANPTYLEAVEDGVTALCAASAEDWARHLAALAGSSARRREIAAKARDTCLMKYHSDRAAETYLQLLNDSGC